MDALLHWDFSPGLAVADQVRRRFGCSVHLSPSPLAKEFFLVVSFSSASFPLSEESVGLALQCCIGGVGSSLRVYKLSDRRFRFSVFSNKVGHFIYGLKDRVWPDFICHFSLYRGDTSGIRFNDGNSWFSNSHNLEVAQRSPTRFKPSLHVLAASAARDPHSSVTELAKFGFKNLEARSNAAAFQKPASPSSSDTTLNSNLISFGSLPSRVDLNKEVNFKLQRTFIVSNCARILCARLPIQTLEIMEDQRQAGYSEEEIMDMLNLPLIPPKDISFEFIGRCYTCGLKDHLQPNCPGVCSTCQRLGHKCPQCLNKSQQAMPPRQ
jgi:hypothetical protein